MNVIAVNNSSIGFGRGAFRAVPVLLALTGAVTSQPVSSAGPVSGDLHTVPAYVPLAKMAGADGTKLTKAQIRVMSYQPGIVQRVFTKSRHIELENKGKEPDNCFRTPIGEFPKGPVYYESYGVPGKAETMTFIAITKGGNAQLYYLEDHRLGSTIITPAGKIQRLINRPN